MFRNFIIHHRTGKQKEKKKKKKNKTWTSIYYKEKISQKDRHHKISEYTDIYLQKLNTTRLYVKHI